MLVKVLDTRGLKSPKPILKLALTAADMKHGETLEVLGDCPKFENDVREWCERLRKDFCVVSEGDEGKAVLTFKINF
jgi:tRNA 2-thiouridine synthesizing protein A